MRKELLLTALILTVVIAGCGQSSELALEERIRRVENGLLLAWGDPPWERMALVDRMAHHHVPGISIAVIDDSEIEWARGYGVLESGGNTPVTPDTLFQTASTGKPVVAAAALHHVETGSLDLDQDVNDRLTSWQVPENEFTAQADVTLRRLLSHSAGTTVSGFVGYTRGQEVPDLQQILNGEPPANSSPIRVNAVPGAQHRYSGGGYMIVQQLLTDIGGQPFPQIMQNAVFGPCRMTSSVFDPLPETRWDNTATGHDGAGQPLAGRWHSYPEMGAGPFWSTPSDMARFGIELMLAYNGLSDRLLSHGMAREMLTPQITFTGEDGESLARGLDLMLFDQSEDGFYAYHPGGNVGYQAVFVVYPRRGQGTVIMSNGDGGEALAREVLKSLSAEYGWVDDKTGLYTALLVSAIALIAGIVVFRRRRGR